MNCAKLRLGVAAILFVGWLGYLSWIALIKPKPIVVSRSQMMVASLAVVAKIELGADGRPMRAVIERVLGHGVAPKIAEGSTIQPLGLSDVRLPGGKSKADAGASYLIPLATVGENQFRVVVSPPAPGYAGPFLPVIYPWGPEVERQVNELLR